MIKVNTFITKLFFRRKTRTRVKKFSSKEKIEKKTILYGIIESWRKFFDNVTLNGLFLIGGNRQTLFTRLYILTVFLTCLTLAFYLSERNFDEYQKMNVRTTIRYDTKPEIGFPAISICPAQLGRKSLFGSSNITLTYLSLAFSRTEEEQKSTMKLNQRLCHIQDGTNRTELEIRAAKITEAYLAYDLITVYKMSSFDSNISIHSCLWNNKEDCSKNFVNHQYDDVSCFSFNQALDDVDLGWTLTSYTYGDEQFLRNRKVLTSTNEISGLELILNTNQEDNCDILPQRSGTGFNILVHDPTNVVSMNLNSHIALSPGYDYTVHMQPVVYDLRNFSESLGKCRNSFYNFLKLNDKIYNRQKCFSTFLAKSFWENCKCLPINSNSSIMNEATARHLNTSVKLLRSCQTVGMEGLFCQKSQLQNSLKQNPDVLYPECLRNCLETKYENKVSATKLSKATVESLLNQQFNTSELVMKNFLRVRFRLQRMEVISVSETQLVTTLNLFNSVGGNLGLFVGMSVMTLYEILHQLLLTLHTVVKNISV